MRTLASPEEAMISLMGRKHQQGAGFSRTGGGDEFYQASFGKRFNFGLGLEFGNVGFFGGGAFGDV